jgi:hypothetical protein
VIGVVAHDAGGAEVISSYVRHHKLACLFCLEGPAWSIFLQKLGPIERLGLNELIFQSSSVLCGTSFASELEWQAIGLARNAGKRSIVVFDHWKNYRSRFVRNKQWHWPDEFWVTDELAYDLAARTLPNMPKILINNYYLDEVVEEIRKAIKLSYKNKNWFNILYVCEPLEQQALNYFLENIKVLPKIPAKIVLRPHPSECVANYEWVRAKYGEGIIVDKSKTLVEQVAECDLVVGCASMAMVVGLLAGKKVMSSLPPGSKTTPLPHHGITRLSDLL